LVLLHSLPLGGQGCNLLLPPTLWLLVVVVVEDCVVAVAVLAGIEQAHYL
jgi:hypothetical protein